MIHRTQAFRPAYTDTSREPLILIVPGHDADEAQHWQKAWAHKWANCERLDLGLWDEPHRNTWVNKLNLAIARADRPVILVAYGLGCLTVAWWAEYEQPLPGDPVIGAVFVAPPDIDRPDIDPRVAKFGAVPRRPLPFLSFLVPCTDDPLCNYRTAYSVARDWGANFIDSDDEEQNAGHPHDDVWPLGEALVRRLQSHSQAASIPRNAPAGIRPSTPLRRGLVVDHAPKPRTRPIATR